MTAPRVARSTAFLLGFGVAFLPSFGPFAAIFFILTTRLRFHRGDVPWLLSALVSAASLAVHDGVTGAVFGLLQILGPWAVYRAFSQLRQPHFESLPRTVALQGLFAGFVVIVAVGFSSVRLNLAYPTITQAIAWGDNPALFAHMVLVVGSVIALLSAGSWLRAGALTVAAIGIVAAGSREAAIALLLVSVYFLLVSAREKHVAQTIGLVGVASAVAVVLFYGPSLGVGRVGFLIDAVPTQASTNLIRGSELPGGDWWDQREVVVRSSRTVLQERPMTMYHVSKRGSAGWFRLQQLVPLNAASTYTVSAWVLDDGPEQAGVQGWGMSKSDGTLAMTATFVDHELVATMTGPGTLLAHGIAASDGPWKRIYVTFRIGNVGRPIDWYVGLAPDARAVTDTSASFAGFQLERGPLTDYRPGAVGRGLKLATGRLTMWRIAWQGIRQHPWVGWGPGAFGRFYQRATASLAVPDGDVPAHAHDLVLEVLFEKGVVGLVGLALLLAAIGLPALRRRDGGFLVVLATVLVANLFDYTFFFGGVIYPLAAVAGWRSGAGTGDQPAADSFSRQFLVRLVLAGMDTGMAWLAYQAALRWIPSLDPAAVAAIPPDSVGHYAIFLWPVLAWREGLYPGYGLTEPDQLKRHVVAALYAGALFLLASVLFTGDLRVAPSIVIATAAFSVVLLPTGRGLAKRALRALALWGRPVVILGSGRLASSIATTLQLRSLDGLRPVAAFADDPAHTRHSDAAVGGVPLIGPISAANAYAGREGIHHAIVAIEPGSPPIHLQKLNPSDNAFTIVQYVPDLPGLPVLGVRTATLDNLLALQVRNELASPFNRAVKRALDLTGVVVGGLLISPLLLALALAVVLDSRGPALFAHTRVGRVGRDGRRIRVWKFRTMVADAAAQLERHLAADPALRAEWEATHKLKDDPRVTRVGRFLRRYSLDELPQLWNVLVGEMSLVGPRPIVDDEVAKYRDAFDLYTMVRPGMTGYWQISGRSDTDYDQRVELDSFYVRNWSVWLDIVVLIKTVSAVLKRDGAY